MTEIGGFFELELAKGEEYHRDAIKLNTGRNAFEYILRAKEYKKVYLPYYTCDVMLEPIMKLDILYEFYSINMSFEPIFDFASIKSDEVFVYTNYFGLCNQVVFQVSKQCDNLIIDNTQAFYSKPLTNVDTFYSARKFFGVPDGSYLYTDIKLNKTLDFDLSYTRFEHLLGRIDLGAEEFYNVFKKNDDNLINQPIKQMSKLTQRILSSINYQSVAIKRKQNFLTFHSILSQTNELSFQIEPNTSPMVYPYLINAGENLKKRLIDSKIYIPTFWPNAKEFAKKKSGEFFLQKNLLPLPIDQRMDDCKINQLIKTINYEYLR